MRRFAALLLLVTPLASAVHGGPQTPPALVTVSGPDPYAHCAPVQPRLLAASETRLAVNPTTLGSEHVNLVGVWQQDAPKRGGIVQGIGTLGMLSASSVDGGRTWAETPIPFTRCAPGGLDFDTVSDPWVSIGPNGTAYTSAVGWHYLTSTSDVDTALAAVSHDGGRTWVHAQAIPPGNLAGADKDSITADPTKSDVAYLVWSASAAAPPTPPSPLWSPAVAVLSKSVDGGRTWTAPQVIARAPPFTSAFLGHQILVDPRSHALYDIFWLRQDKTRTTLCRWVKDPKHPKRRKRCQTIWRSRKQNSIAFVSSHDSGASWSKIHIVAHVQLPNQQREAPPRTAPGIPEGAIDTSTGRIYLTWEAAATANGDYGRIMLSSSSDGGSHWTKPTQISQANGLHAGLPSIAVGARGVVGVTYYTMPSVRQQSLPADYWFVSSSDAGAHFGNLTHLAGPFDLASSQYNTGAYFLGDYQGLVAAGSTFYLLFVMPSQGGPPGEVVSTSIPVSAPPLGAGSRAALGRWLSPGGRR